MCRIMYTLAVYCTVAGTMHSVLIKGVFSFLGYMYVLGILVGYSNNSSYPACENICTITSAMYVYMYVPLCVPLVFCPGCCDKAKHGSLLYS